MVSLDLHTVGFSQLGWTPQIQILVEDLPGRAVGDSPSLRKLVQKQQSIA